MSMKRLGQVDKVPLHPDIIPVKNELERLRKEGKVLLAYLFGSYAVGDQHARSDIDIAVYIVAGDGREVLDVEDRILMSSDREIGLLRLENEDEDPNIVLDAINGVPLVEGDEGVYYEVARKAMHEGESIRHIKG